MHLSPFFGDAPPSKICTFDVERYKKLRLEEDAQHNVLKDGTKLYKGKTKLGTINRELAALSHLGTDRPPHAAGYHRWHCRLF